MPDWNDYPADYRHTEVEYILAAARAGESVSVVGLSGAGKSNLAGFLAQQAGEGLSLVDCNRLVSHTPDSFFQLTRRALASIEQAPDELAALEQAIAQRLEAPPRRVCLVFDRFDGLPLETQHSLYGNLRALRDEYKYRLTYVTFTRRPLDERSELAELFYAHTLWLGPLSESDARWSIDGYAYRQRSRPAPLLGGLSPPLGGRRGMRRFMTPSWKSPGATRLSCAPPAKQSPPVARLRHPPCAPTPPCGAGWRSSGRDNPRPKTCAAWAWRGCLCWNTACQAAT